MSLTHWYNSEHSDVIAAWLGANPSYRDDHENAAQMFSRVGETVTRATLDTAWKQVKAAPVSGEIDHDTHGLDSKPAWTLAQALLAKVEHCPFSGARTQMKDALAHLFTAGGPWFIAEGKYKAKGTAE